MKINNLKKTSPRGVRGLSLSLALVLMLGIFTVLTPPAHAAYPGANGKIAFYSDRDGNNEIYAMNADGSGQTRLTNNVGQDVLPQWSPDGTKLVFQTNRDGNYEIYVMNADGSGQTRITNNSADDFSPTWSPDGAKIAFTSDRDGNNEIYVMNADGSGQTRITNNSADDSSSIWSPNGTKLTVWSDRDDPNYEIYTMNVDGSGITRLTNNSAYDYAATWSPDSTKLGFETDRDGNIEIYVMNADGSGQTRLTNNSSGDFNPTWSPDGAKIAFTSDRDGNNEIYVMNADGSGQTRLTNNSASDVGISWQTLNTSPVVAADTVSVAFGGSVVIDVLANDKDNVSLNAASLTITAAPAHGTAIVSSGKITYTPQPTFAGVDSLTYQICDNGTPPLCSTSTVSIIVLPGLPKTGTGSPSNTHFLLAMLAIAVPSGFIVRLSFKVKTSRP